MDKRTRLAAVFFGMIGAWVLYSGVIGPMVVTPLLEFCGSPPPNSGATATYRPTVEQETPGHPLMVRPDMVSSGQNDTVVTMATYRPLVEQEHLDIL